MIITLGNTDNIEIETNFFILNYQQQRIKHSKNNYKIINILY